MKKQIDLLSEYGDCLPGEDRLFGVNKFYIDAIPLKSHYHSLRLMMPLSQWQRLRLYVINRANSKCEFCGNSSNLQAHERWHFDEVNKTQKALRLMCLCRGCHMGVHIGVTTLLGYFNEVKQHVLNITGWTENEFSAHLNQSGEEYQRLSKIKWKIDVSLVNNIGILMYNKKKIEENIEKKRNEVEKSDSKYLMAGVDYRKEIFEGYIVFCTLKRKRKIILDSLPLFIDSDLEYRDYYAAKKIKPEEIDFPTMPLKEFVATYHNVIAVANEHQLSEELKTAHPKRLLISGNFQVSEDLIERAFQNSILLSFS